MEHAGAAVPQGRDVRLPGPALHPTRTRLVEAGAAQRDELDASLLQLLAHRLVHAVIDLEAGGLGVYNDKRGWVVAHGTFVGEARGTAVEGEQGRQAAAQGTLPLGRAAAGHSRRCTRRQSPWRAGRSPASGALRRTWCWETRWTAAPAWRQGAPRGGTASIGLGRKTDTRRPLLVSAGQGIDVCCRLFTPCSCCRLPTLRKSTTYCKRGAGEGGKGAKASGCRAARRVGAAEHWPQEDRTAATSVLFAACTPGSSRTRPPSCCEAPPGRRG